MQFAYGGVIVRRIVRFCTEVRAVLPLAIGATVRASFKGLVRTAMQSVPFAEAPRSF